MINGVHHVSFATADMDAFIGFYHGLIGLPIRSDGVIGPETSPTPFHHAFEMVVGIPGARVRSVQLAGGNVRIEAFQYLEPEPTPGKARPSCDVGIRHIAFDVTDIDAEYERLVAAGAVPISTPQTMGDRGVRAVYLRDPDGNMVELQEILPGSAVDKSHVRSPLA